MKDSELINLIAVETAKLLEPKVKLNEHEISVLVAEIIASKMMSSPWLKDRKDSIYFKARKIAEEKLGEYIYEELKTA